MKTNAIHQRLARLQRECDVAIGPQLLLCVAGAVFVTVLGLDVLIEETNPGPATASSRQAIAPTN